MPATGTSIALPLARRRQAQLAAAVVVLPCIATLVALGRAVTTGVSAVALGAFAVMFVLGTTGMSVGLHRHFAHRTFRTSAPVRVALAALGGMNAQGPLLFWVAHHRAHHVFSDLEGDPHSPNLHGRGFQQVVAGLWHAHVGWMFTERPPDVQRFARDLVGDPAARLANGWYAAWVIAGFAVPAVGAGLAAGTLAGAMDGLLWGGFVRMFFVNHFSWCVGSVCHVFGSRPFATADRSANNYAVALVTFGEGLQNNHHAFPGSARHGLRWWEPDVSGWIITLLARSGLVWDVKTPSRTSVDEARRAATLQVNTY